MLNEVTTREMIEWVSTRIILEESLYQEVGRPQHTVRPNDAMIDPLVIYQPRGYVTLVESSS
jgi:hypothetical protein